MSDNKTCPVCGHLQSVMLHNCEQCGWDYPVMLGSGEVVKSMLESRLAATRKEWQLQQRNPDLEPNLSRDPFETVDEFKERISSKSKNNDSIIAVEEEVSTFVRKPFASIIRYLISSSVVFISIGVIWGCLFCWWMLTSVQIVVPFLFDVFGHANNRSVKFAVIALCGGCLTLITIGFMINKLRKLVKAKVNIIFVALILFLLTRVFIYGDFFGIRIFHIYG